ncbi:unnamed protein product, partial [marine sediment metagenome]
DLREVPGFTSGRNAITIIHFADPPYFHRIRWSMLDSATFATFEVLGGLTNNFCAYGRGGRIRTGDHLNPIQVRYLAALHPDLLLALFHYASIIYF